MRDYQSVTDPSFLQTVLDWMSQNGSVLCLIRYHGGASKGEYRIFDSKRELLNCLENLSPRTNVIVSGEPQLQMRGIVDENFISEALNRIPDGKNWLLVGLEAQTAGRQSWFHESSGSSCAELESELRDNYCWGRPVAIGQEPDMMQSSCSIIDGIVPNWDGTIEPGVY